ncbi:MAG: hypothetical protein QGG73_04210, partial [Candidatus Hydrogenedentes bacterium]|nr:hypothetical protein [Candidatus Hydrogenedentota bacterium]
HRRLVAAAISIMLLLGAAGALLPHGGHEDSGFGSHHACALCRLFELRVDAIVHQQVALWVVLAVSLVGAARACRHKRSSVYRLFPQRAPPLQ